MPDPANEPVPTPASRPDHHGLGVDHPADKPARKRKGLRTLVKLLVVLVVLLAALVGLAPWLLSTGPGTGFIVSMINGQVDGELSIDELSLSWGKGQRVFGITYRDPAAGLDAQVREIDAPDIGLLALIRGSRAMGQVTLRDVTTVYTQSESSTGDPPKDDALDEPGDAEDFHLPGNLSGSMVIQNLKATYQSPSQDPVVLTLDQGILEATDLRDITFDFDASLKQGVREGSVVLSGGAINLFDPDGYAQPAEASYKLDSEIQGLSTVVVDNLARELGVQAEPGLIAQLLGKGGLKASAKAGGTIDQLLAEVHIETRNLAVNLYQERDGDTLIASPRSTASLRLTPKGFGRLFKNSSLKMTQDRVFTLSSLEMRLPMNDDGIDLDAASAKVTINTDGLITLKGVPGDEIQVDALAITGKSNALARRIEVDFSATLAAADGERGFKPEPVKAELVIDRPLDEERQVVFFSEALPIKLADALAGQDGQLVLWLGEMLAMKAQLKGRLVEDEQGESALAWDFSLAPEGRLTGEVTGGFEGDRYTLATRDRAPVEATLVPEAFASLMEMVSGRPGKPTLTIDKPMPVYITLRDPKRGDVAITTRPGKKGVKRFYPDPDQTYVGATIELSQARVYDPARQKHYELRGGALSLSAPDLRGRTQVKADLRLTVRPDAGQGGIPALMSWQTTVSDLLSSDGGIPLDGEKLMQQIAMDGGVTLKNAPSELFDSLLNRNGDIASVLGPVVDQLDAGFTYSDGRASGASVRLNWDDKNNRPLSNASASLRPAMFDIDDQQMLTVRGGKDIALEVKVTETFGDRWMGQLHPILFDAKSGDRPVSVKIDGDSFRFPLNDPSMKGARVEAVVDLGSIEFGKDALLGKIMQWTKRPGERAVFDPAKIALVDGKIRYEQFGMTVGNVRLRLDGEVDLASGEIVQMAVRVPGKSLIHVFSELEGIIAADDYLNIPMTGSIREPKFDRQLITREVAGLVASNLLKQQRDKLRDKIGIGESPEAKAIDGAFDLIFGRRNDPPRQEDPKPNQPEDKPEDEGKGPEPREQEPAAEEQKPLEDQLKDKAIEGALDLIFGQRRRPAERDNDEE